MKQLINMKRDFIPSIIQDTDLNYTDISFSLTIANAFSAYTFKHMRNNIYKDIYYSIFIIAKNLEVT